MKDRISLLLIDCQPLFREGIKAVMKTAARFKIVGEADDGPTGFKLATTLNPDIIITDIAIPGFDGIELTRRLKKSRPAPKVLILTMLTGINHISLAMQAGAAGYLLKDSAIEKILTGITAIANNQTFMDVNISQAIPDESMGIKFLEHYDTQNTYEKLTPREQQVMRGLAQEASRQELAENLSITIKTVENHRSNIMRKLGLKREIELIRFAAQIGLIDTST